MKASEAPAVSCLKLRVLRGIEDYEFRNITGIAIDAVSGWWCQSHPEGEPTFFRGTYPLKRFLLIFNALIFDSRVVPGMPSLAAAPEGPCTLPPHSRRAASIMAFS